KGQICMGEVRGRAPDGFNFGNSPSRSLLPISRAKRLSSERVPVHRGSWRRRPRPNGSTPPRWSRQRRPFVPFFRVHPSNRSPYELVIRRLPIAEQFFHSTRFRQPTVSADREQIKQLPKPGIRHCCTQHEQAVYPLKLEACLAGPLVEFDPRHALTP